MFRLGELTMFAKLQTYGNSKCKAAAPVLPHLQ